MRMWRYFILIGFAFFCAFVYLFVCLSLFWWSVIKATIDLNETFKG